MIKSLMVAARDRDRLAEILRITTRFGLDMLVARIGLAGETPPADAPGEQPAAGAADPLPRRARLALEALGPTFVKLGQILATRADLLAPEWIAELEQLHSNAPTLPFAALRDAVEAALGQPPESAFASFDPEPLAAASIAQVHRATLPDGRAVVVKIRRPGIRPRMEADLRLIAHLARLAEASSAEARRFAPAAMVRQLAEAVLAELDFRAEGRNADRLRADFADDPRVVVPEIHWDWTSETLLVMDYIDGVAPRDAATLRAAGIDPAAIAALGADIVLDMVLVNGRFHADPHPGNLLCLPGNRIALIDLGMIGHVSPRRRAEFLRFVQAIVTGDPAALAETLAGWAQQPSPPPEPVQRAAERLVARHGGTRLELAALVGDFMPLLREEGLTMPPDLLLIFKAMVTIDGVLAGIEPGFDLSGAVRRAFVRILGARLSPGSWGPAAGALAWEVARLGEDAPRLLRALVRRIEAPEPAPAPAADPALPRAVTRAGQWIAVAIVAAAAILAVFG